MIYFVTFQHFFCLTFFLEIARIFPASANKHLTRGKNSDLTCVTNRLQHESGLPVLYLKRQDTGRIVIQELFQDMQLLVL